MTGDGVWPQWYGSFGSSCPEAPDRFVNKGTFEYVSAYKIPYMGLSTYAFCWDSFMLAGAFFVPY